MKHRVKNEDKTSAETQNEFVGKHSDAVKKAKESSKPARSPNGKKRRNIIITVIVLAALIIVSTATLTGALVGLRGTYINVNDPNEFYSFVLGSYHHYSSAGNDDSFWHGSWKRKGNVLTLEGGEGDVSYFRAQGRYDDVHINNAQYKRVSLIWYNFLKYEKTVKFVLNDGSGVETTKQIKIGDHVSAPAAPTREGYIFRGWYPSTQGYRQHGKPFRNNDRVWENSVFYANWSSNVRYSVSNVDSSNEDIYVYEDDLLLNKLKDAETTGKTYDYLMSRAVGSEKWVPVEEYTYAPNYDIKVKRAGNGVDRDVKIEYDLNGGVVADGVKTVITKKYNTKFHISESPKVTRDGYNFIAWCYTNEKGETTKYYSDDFFTVPVGVPVGRATLVAEWNEKALVEFDAGGGTGKLQTDSIYATTGDTIRLPNCDFIYEGHSFFGWCDGNRVYRFNGNYKLTTPTVKFTAKWVDNSAALTRVDDKGDPSAEGEHVVFGMYPQNKKSQHVTLSGAPDAQGYYTGSDGALYVKKRSNTRITGKIFADETVIIDDMVYYFRVSPLIWRILDDKGGKLIIMPKMIIDTKTYLETDESGISDYYKSDWEHSSVRDWLNDEESGFLSGLNLSAAAKEKICIKTNNNNDNAIGELGNRFAKDQNQTQDKVFLFCYKNLTAKREYEYSLETHASRIMFATDYSRCCGLQFDNRTGAGRWWTRSAANYDEKANPNGDSVTFVSADGNFMYQNSSGEDIGIVPVMFVNYK